MTPETQIIIILAIAVMLILFTVNLLGNLENLKLKEEQLLEEIKRLKSIKTPEPKNNLESLKSTKVQMQTKKH